MVRQAPLIYLFALLPLLWVSAATATVQPETQPFNSQGLYSPTVYHLGNGLRVILKPRPHVPSVSIRAVVGLGTSHYPCGYQEVPHFLEHMLFDAIPGVSEAEFEQIMFEHGGSMNAITGTRATTYEFRIHSRNVPVALESLSRFLFQGELSEQAFRLTRSVIRQEFGGEPTRLERWMHRSGFQRSGWHELLQAKSAEYFGACDELDWGQRVTFAHVAEAYERYYWPGNVSLILVGDFDLEEARSRVLEHFGDVEEVDGAHPTPAPVSGLGGGGIYEGYEEAAAVGIAFATDGHLGDDYQARELVSHYLRNRLFQRLRVDSGLTYTPLVTEYAAPGFGLFVIRAELTSDAWDEARAIIDEELGRLRAGELAGEEFRKAQESLLLNWAQGRETNNAFANYYAGTLAELDHHGELRNREAVVASLTAQELRRVAQELFRPDNRVEVRDRRFADRVQTALLAIGLATAVLLGAFLLLVWRSRRR